ncbi:methionine synthase [Planctomycetota bacterium]|nr:methionine synthase [Planctomycetota bacterium]
MTTPAHDQPGHVCGALCPHHGGLPKIGLHDPISHLGYRRDERAALFPYLAALRERVLIYDGGFGTELFKFQLAPSDLGTGKQDGCVELIHRTRPEIAPSIHRKYFAAGADVVETHSFNAFPHAMAEFGISPEDAEQLAELAGRAACGPRDEFSTAKRPRFVAGALGSGTKMPSLGAIAWAELFESYRAGARGLLRGGVDLLLIETAQDILQVKCTILACRQAMRDLGREVPIQAQVTVETTGTMLAGSDIAAALAALEALPVDVVGMNCATGPDLMDSHIRHLAEHATRFVSCLPNAGLPRNEGGKAIYDLTPAELARWHVKFVRDYGVNAVGGCCGTTPAHIAAVVEAVHGMSVKERPATYPATLSSLHAAMPIRQDTGILIVGERTNATGSKAFRELLFKDDWDGIVHLAQEQVAEGAHVLDVSVAWTGRDERRDMREVMQRLAKIVKIPIMVDSTQVDVVEIALQHLGGRAIINSVNLEDGEEKLDAVCRLARTYGAALVALTIDEDREAGMAKTVERKVAIAERIHRLLTERHGIPSSSILFDLLTFPITSGDADTRKLGLWTLEGIAAVKARLPECGYILGLSNVSFGVKPYARQVLNSVYLDEAIQRGLTGAILNASKIVPIDRIPANEVSLARDVIYDRRVFAADGSVSHDPLFAFVNHFTSATSSVVATADAFAALPVEERLKRRIIDGKKIGIEGDLDLARASRSPLSIINDVLLDGMKTVGELFGSGKMQLPFVLQSAETMKAAVRHLEQFMERSADAQKGTMVLATVKGDVHDIGKNLVDIILTNNGYRVVNLGIKQPIEDILKAVEQHRPDAIGMSGLLVKSTVVMKDNLEYLAERGLRHQVILGGAALNRAYVENDLRNLYNPSKLPVSADDGRTAATGSQPPAPSHLVWYAPDAFDGLQLMEELCGHVAPDKLRLTTKATRKAVVKTAQQILDEKLAAGTAYVPSGIPAAPRIPKPPFWGRRIVESAQLDLPTICRYINTNALFRGQWGFRQGQELTKEQWQELVEREAEPVLRRWIATATRDKMLEPQVVYGYFPCASERNDLVVFDPVSGAEAARFNLPRQMEPDSKHLCIADFLRPRGADAIGDEASWIPSAAWANGARDVLAVHCVTMGKIASEHCQRLFKADNYQEYLYFYGLSVETAEALAEYWHKRIRQQLDIAGDDALEMADLFTQGYQGSRYSFGYPACPRLEDQRMLQDLLRWQDIGIELSEEFQLHPEQSTSALILHHPAARYFNL